ncbi:MAG: acyl-CoA dehydrogenase [Sphingobium sp.]
MNFDLTEEQGLLRDLILRFGADRYDSVQRLAYLREPHGFSRTNWELLADTGLLAFALPEVAGGFGGSDADIITVAEALGTFVAVEPVLASVIMGTGIVYGAASEDQRAALIPDMVAGKCTAALAVFEPHARFETGALQARATETEGGGYALSGSKQMVLGGPFADNIVVAARAAEQEQASLFLVEAKAPGLAFRNYRLADGSMASDIDLNNVAAEIMPGGLDALHAVVVQARLAICAELVGLMEMMFRETLEYLKTRQQFGQPLGSFQAIQHRMADCYAKVELSRSQLYRAAGQGSDPVARDIAIRGAKAYIAQSAMHVGEEAIQLHGGIGTTEELLVGQAFKRVFTLAALLGDADADLRNYVAQTRAA